jgi:hypothetical protein
VHVLGWLVLLGVVSLVVFEVVDIVKKKFD